MIPKNHARKVKQGSVGSSVVGTVNRTCSTGQSFRSSVMKLELITNTKFKRKKI
ncbi:hypothetical protein Hanom_Chr16g01455231 [Helianthus anomalus]